MTALAASALMESAAPPLAADDGVRALLLRTAREVADDLAADAVDRDHAGRAPVDEAGRLRDAGLPAALTPPGPDRGADWRTGCAVIQQIAAADSSVGELLARHYAHGWDVRFHGAAEQAAALERASVQGGLLWAGAGNGPAPSLLPLGAGHLLHGVAAVHTAATVADCFLVDAVCPGTGDVLVVRVPADHPGVSVDPAADRLGQRVAGAGAVAFDGVTVPEAAPGGVPETLPQVVGVRPPDAEATAPYTALAPSALRLALAHVGLGNLHGALAEARDLSRAAPAHRPAAPAGLPPAEDPDLLLAFGELASAAHTATAVVDRATDALADALAPGVRLDVEQPADIAALVATAEAVTARAALHLTARVLELADAPGLDRHWRNARTLTAHRSPA
ncbi:acyl-CoA dehydrogenase, partial [Streptomyces solincola]